LSKRKYIVKPEEINSIIGKEIYYTERRKLIRGYIITASIMSPPEDEVPRVKADIRLNWRHGKDRHDELDIGRLYHATRKGYGKVIRADGLRIFILKEMYKVLDCDDCSSNCKKPTVCSLATLE